MKTLLVIALLASAVGTGGGQNPSPEDRPNVSTPGQPNRGIEGQPVSPSREQPGSLPSRQRGSPDDEALNLLKAPMIFYVAKGQPDTCGPGCHEWIAAEGEFDLGAPQRLRKLLARPGIAKMPIYFHSPGGLAQPALAIGRMLRQKGMTAGVSKTNPEKCTGMDEKTCKSLKQSSQTLAAELHGLARCNSACVYALIGAKVRQIPPSARLGVHASRSVRIRHDGLVIANTVGPSDQQTRARDLQIRSYVRETGIDVKLVDIAAKVPHEKLHYLTRDEIANLGIDTRAFQETPWLIVDERRSSYVAKFIGEAKGADRREFRASMIMLACAGPGRAAMTYARGLASDEVGRAVRLEFLFGDHKVDLSQNGRTRKFDALEADGVFGFSFDNVPFDTFDAAVVRGSVEIQESPRSPSTVPPRIVRLSVQGLSKGMTMLRDKCASTK